MVLALQQAVVGRAERGQGDARRPERLRELMRARGVTALDIAGRIGVSKNTVTNWSKGHTPLVPAHVLALADELGTSIDALAGRYEYSDETIDVYRPLEVGPFDQIGRVNRE